jgi:hypothetical protein
VLRIVGIHRSEHPEEEFVLLQNQGALKSTLRGHILISEDAFERGLGSAGSYVFLDDVSIAPGLYVLLTTGRGSPHWARTRDGAHAYRAYMGADRSVWRNLEGALTLLAPQHTFTERGGALLLR